MTRPEQMRLRHTDTKQVEALLTSAGDDAEALYRDRNRELIAQLEAVGHEPVVKNLRFPSQVGHFGRTWMFCRRCGREADRILFNRLSPSKRCPADTGDASGA